MVHSFFLSSSLMLWEFEKEGIITDWVDKNWFVKVRSEQTEGKTFLSL